MRAARWLLGAGVALAASLAALCRPFDPRTPVPRPDPARGYEVAVRRWEAVSARDGAEVNPECRAIALLHGRRTGRAVVLFHGLANCPKQCARLADSLHARGCNVIVPRTPYHGLSDRMTPEQSRLTAGDLALATDEAVDVACGLGDSVVVAGLSTGALQAAWAGQFRPDVSRAVLICPVFGVGVMHPFLTTGFTRAILTLPNMYLWWDPRYRENVPGPKQVYPRYSTGALGEILKFGFVVQAAARRQRPAARTVSVVTSASDLAVSNAVTAGVVRDWNRRGALVRTREYPRSLGAGHDVLDPGQPYAKPDLTYPALVAEIMGESGARR